MKNRFDLYRFSGIIVCLLLLVGCGGSLGFERSSGLPEPQLQNYLDAYKQLKTDAPTVLKKINRRETDFSNSDEEYNRFENIIKTAGIKDYTEFVQVNNRVGIIFSILQVLQKREQSENNQAQMDDMASFIQEQIDDPDVPEATKNELRQKLEEVQKGKEAFNTFYDSPIWAKTAVKMAKRLANMTISEEEAHLIVKHETDILEAYSGFPMPPAIEIPTTELEDEDMD